MSPFFTPDQKLHIESIVQEFRKIKDTLDVSRPWTESEAANILFTFEEVLIDKFPLQNGSLPSFTIDLVRKGFYVQIDDWAPFIRKLSETYPKKRDVYES